jgi:hypothetical protein
MTNDELEQCVLDYLIAGADDEREVLRQQAKVRLVRRRENTGVGFFTEFEVPKDVPRTKNLNFELGAHTAVSNLEHGVGFALFVRAGTLSMLEGFTYDEPWPGEFSYLHWK